MIPARYAHIVFGLFLSAMMSFIVSGISTFLAIGLIPGVFATWRGGWLPSWAGAFPVVLFVAPLARRMVAALTIKE